MAASSYSTVEDLISIKDLSKEFVGLVVSVAENESVFQEDIDQAVKVLLAFKDHMIRESPLSELPPEESGNGSIAEISVSRTILALKMAIKVLLMLMKKSPSTSFEAMVHQLLSMLSNVYSDLKPDVQEELMATIMDVVIDYDYGKKIVGQNTKAMPLIIDVLRSGSALAQSYALATICELSTVDFNKVTLGQLDGMVVLVNALEKNEVAEKGVHDALFKLCEVPCNISRAGKDGVLRVILDAIKGNKFLDKMLVLLERLKGNLKRHKDMSMEAVPLLLGIIRDTANPSHQHISAAIILSLSRCNQLLLGEIRKEEEDNHTISKLRKDGTISCRLTAENILQML